MSEGDANPERQAPRGRTSRPSTGHVARKARVLRAARDFEAVLKSGHRSASRNFVLRARTNDLEHARLGVIAGRKAAPRAVDRNRAKRLIREAFRAKESVLGTCDITIQLRRNPRAEQSAALRAELAALIDAVARRTAGTIPKPRHEP